MHARGRAALPRTGGQRRAGTAFPPHGAVHARGAGHEVGRRPAGNAGTDRRARLLPGGGKGRPLSPRRVGHLEAAIERGAVAAPAKEAPKPAKAPAPAKERRPKAAPPPKSAAEAPPQYLQAVEALSKANPSMRAALEGMKFAGYDGGVVTAEFARKQLMFYEDARAQARTDGGRLHGGLWRAHEAGDAPGGRGPRRRAPPPPKPAASSRQSYDVFGRENIDLTD